MIESENLCIQWEVICIIDNVNIDRSLTITLRKNPSIDIIILSFRMIINIYVLHCLHYHLSHIEEIPQTTSKTMKDEFHFCSASSDIV